MAVLANLTREEKFGLVIAAAAHVALAAALMLQDEPERPLAIPERMDVSLATEVSLESTAPDPSSQPAASAAPVVAAIPEPAPPAPVIERPVEPPVRPPVETRPEPVRQQVQPQPRPQPQPTRRAPPVERTRPDRQQATPTPAPRATQARPARQETPRQQTGSTRMDNFLEGVSSGQGDSGSPAQTAGPAQRASIVQAINRQLKPKWTPPSGVDVEELTTVVRFRLNRDGSLAGAPQVVRTTGQNDSNRTQVSRHQEQAVRAVRLASPFDLPEQYYAVWQDLEWNFDNRLAQ